MVIIKKYFVLRSTFDIKKGKPVLDDLNKLLNDIGICFTVSKNDIGQILDIYIDEDILHKSTLKKAGRPKGNNFDLEQIQQMKLSGMKNKEIYTELGISKSLFYLRMKESK